MRVASGTYQEFGLAMPSGVTLQGASDDASTVIIDGQDQGRILDCLNLENPAYIQNITFTGGRTVDGWFDALGGGVRAIASSVSLSNCRFVGNNARIGAGFGASESSLFLTDCAFIANHATHPEWSAGGAIWARDCAGQIQDCLVLQNSAFSENPGNPGDGGGFFFNNNRLDVSSCLFQENSTGAGAGGFYSVTTDSSIFTDCDFVSNTAANGGAVYYEYEAAAQLIDCRFLNNIATAGGAIVTFNGSYPTIRNCRFEGNQATQWGGGAIDGWSSVVSIENSTFISNSAQTHGGATNFGDCTVDFSGCLFQSNVATGLGGALRCHYSQANLSQCTLVGNSASGGAGIYCGTSSSATVDHSIITFSSLSESMSGLEEGFATISCSDIYNNFGGDWVGDFADQININGNFSADPLFCDSDQGEFSLDASSPCAPGDQGACGLIGALGVGCQISASPHGMVPNTDIQVMGNFPNPFNPSTSIRFQLNREGPTTVSVFDMAGRKVQTLVNSYLSARIHDIPWFGEDDMGQEMAAGIYFYRISSGETVVFGRMALIK